jgi:cell division protein FtsQ
MAQTIRRNATGVRRQAAAQGRAGQVRKARAHTSGLFDKIMTALPFTEEQWHRFFTVLILAVALAIVVVIARLSGATTMAEQYFAQVAANAGFKVVNVVPRGTERMNEARIYEVALGQEDLSMVLVDLDQLRAELMQINWVKDARVSRQLPDTLVIDIVEREPHAVLRRADRLVLIDATGVELEPIAANAVGDLLVIAGEGAQSQVQALEDLLDAAPALVPQIKAAEWVGNRRWNVTFRTDQQLALPEGEDRAAAALISFARADGVHRLIGGEVVRFDMRNAPRMFMAVPGRAERELDMQPPEDS